MGQAGIQGQPFEGNIYEKNLYEYVIFLNLVILLKVKKKIQIWGECLHLLMEDKDKSSRNLEYQMEAQEWWAPKMLHTKVSKEI